MLVCGSKQDGQAGARQLQALYPRRRPADGRRVHKEARLDQSTQGHHGLVRRPLPLGRIRSVGLVFGRGEAVGAVLRVEGIDGVAFNLPEVIDAPGVDLAPVGCELG